MSLGGYLLGVAGLGLVVAAMMAAAIRLRAVLLPGWSGSPARLAEIVLGISVVTVLLQVLGLLGILDPLPLVGGAVLCAFVCRRFLSPPDPAAAKSPPAPETDGALRALAIAVALVVAGRWATGLEYSWENGMNHFDSVWYHAPFAAKFAQEGSIWSLHFTDPLYLNWFYPQNSELQHSAGLLLFGRDLVSLLINMGWLGVTLLAAWCVGRPYRSGPIAVIGVAAVVATVMLFPREPGNAATDIAPIALLLATAAILVNAEAAGRVSRGALVVAGLATGLAIGTKLTAVAVAAALTVGIAVIASRGDRLRSTSIWLGAIAVTGGLWYFRNLVHAGNPVPWIKELGPIDLPGPDRTLQGRDPFSVSHYIFDPGGIDADAFLVPLRDLLGAAWPAMLGLAALGVVLGLARPRTPVVRVLGAVGVVATVAYLFTPLTASGPEGTAQGFGVNLRYAAPALALGLALLALDPRLTGTAARRTATTLLLLSLFVIVLLTTGDNVVAQAATTWVAVAVALVLIAAPIALAETARERPAAAAVAGAALLAVVVAIGWFKQDDYLQERFRQGVGYGIGPTVQVADDLSGQRIALGGSAAGFYQYGFYGRDLSNYVQYVGRHRPNGDFVAYEECADWRRALNAGDYDYLVVTGNLDLNYSERTSPAIESVWAIDPAATPVVEDGQVRMFELNAELDPARCPHS